LDFYQVANERISGFKDIAGIVYYDNIACPVIEAHFT
jgi:hypothetical protein